MKKKVIRVSTIPTSLNTLLTGQLKMLNENGYEVIGLSSPGAELQEVEQREGIRTISVPMQRRIAPFHDLISLYKLVKIFRSEKPWMVHSITPKAGLLSMMAAKIVGTPVRIHTFTGLIFPTAKGIQKRILMFTDWLTCACATKIIPEGNGVKNDLINNHITNKGLHILANGNVNGIDTNYFKQRENRKDSHKFTFIFVGRIVRDKGICELCTAFRQLSNELPNVRLLLLGNFEDHLDPISKDDKDFLLQSPNIEYLGYQTDVRPYFEQSDALVFPSYREGFPNVVLQAGAMNLPSIVTNINGCNEIIINHKNGIIIPSHDANALYHTMKSFVLDKEATSTMASNARPLVENRYQQSIVWSAILNEYKTLEHNV